MRFFFVDFRKFPRGVVVIFEKKFPKMPHFLVVFGDFWLLHEPIQGLFLLASRFLESQGRISLFPAAESG